MVHTQSIAPVFDPRYKAVVFVPPSDTPYYERVDWVSNNTSTRMVDVKFENHGMYIAFEDENDALIFKIKFL